MTFNPQPGTLKMFKFQSLLLAGACALLGAAGSAQAVVVFDNISAYEASTPGAALNYTSSTPNTFMGDAYTLAAGTTQITGFDLFPINGTTTNFTALKLNLFVWGGVNTTGTVNATTPAFSNLLGSYTFTATGTFTSGFYYSFESATPGLTPGLVLPSPITVPGLSVGLTINVQGSTDNITFANFSNLTTIISSGVPATVGSNVFNGYYRNAGTPTETNGNFTSSLRSLGLTNQSLATRIYGNVSAVPEPASVLLMGMGALALLALRRRQAN
jgi:hypothetical protein